MRCCRCSWIGADALGVDALPPDVSCEPWQCVPAVHSMALSAGLFFRLKAVADTEA